MNQIIQATFLRLPGKKFFHSLKSTYHHSIQMIMKKHLFVTLFLFLLSYPYGKSQQLVPTVISSSGGFYSTPSAMLSFTTGELASIETYSAPGLILTQGFHQSWV